jgi:predicted secreted protein
MTAAIVILAVLLASAAGTVLVLSLRQSGLRSEAEEADERRTDAEKKLTKTAENFTDYKRRTEDQLAALRGDIEELEDDLEKCTAPGARRARLERLLSKAANPKDRDGALRVSEGGRSAARSP